MRRSDRGRARAIFEPDVKLIDRYLVREVVPPFLLALGMFTFLLAVKPMLEQAQQLLAKGVDLPTVGFLLATLLPQALGVTIPMAFLAGVLMGLGRLSGDREAVALLACGVSPLRLLRAILVMALVAGAADMYLMVRMVPDANQRFREETFRLLARQGQNDIKAGIFYEGFPGKVLRVRQVRPDGGWSGVMLADTSQPGRPAFTLAASGYLDVDPANRQVSIVLPGQAVRYLPGEEDGVYDMQRAEDLRFAVPAESVFGTGDIMPTRGLSEMRIADLRRLEAEKRAAGISPHQEIMQRHQMFSFPVACLVFAISGLALGLHTRREGKLAGFTLGIGVIFVYYAVMIEAQSLTKGGHFPAEWARWVPNIVVGILGGIALWIRTRKTGSDFTIAWPAWLRLRQPRAATARPVTRAVVVVRIPDLRLPRPRILDVYVSRRYVAVAVLSFVGLLGLYYIGTLIDKSERLFKGQADGWMLIQYFYYSTPQFITYIMPMATLIAVLATIGGLTRTGELVVMRACGVSLYRVVVPLLLLAAILSGGLFVLNDRVVAKANRRAEVLEDEIKGNPPHTVNVIANANWLADKQDRIYYYAAFDVNRQALYGLSVFHTSADGSRLVSQTFTRQAVFDHGTWHAGPGWIQRFPAPDRAVREDFTARALPLEPPQSFSGMHNQEADLMTFSELRRHIADLTQSGLNLADSRVQLQERLAFPFAALVMTLLGVPFGITTGRRGALYGIGLAIGTRRGLLAAQHVLPRGGPGGPAPGGPGGVGGEHPVPRARDLRHAHRPDLTPPSQPPGWLTPSVRSEIHTVPLVPGLALMVSTTNRSACSGATTGRRVVAPVTGSKSCSRS